VGAVHHLLGITKLNVRSRLALTRATPLTYITSMNNATTVASWIRSDCVVDHSEVGGFCQVKTSEVAAHFAISQKAALVLLNAAAKAGLVTKGERIGFKGAQRGKHGNTACGELTWEILLG
jgi:hypothetical protein